MGTRDAVQHQRILGSLGTASRCSDKLTAAIQMLEDAEEDRQRLDR